MTTWFSDHFGTDGDNDITLPASPTVIPVGVGHGRKYAKRAVFTGLGIAADTIRVMRFREEDRLYNLHISVNGGSDAGAINVGLHEAGANHDGAVIDADLFASALTISSALDETEIFDESSVLSGIDRGKRMWELAAVGAASYTAAPNLVQGFEIVYTVSTTFTTTDSIIVLIATYTSGS